MSAADDFASFGVPIAITYLPGQERSKGWHEVQADPRNDNDEVNIVQSYNRHRGITNTYKT